MSSKARPFYTLCTLPQATRMSEPYGLSPRADPAKHQSANDCDLKRDLMSPEIRLVVLVSTWPLRLHSFDDIRRTKSISAVAKRIHWTGVHSIRHSREYPHGGPFN